MYLNLPFQLQTVVNNNLFGLNQIRSKWTNWQMVRDHKRRMMVKEHAVDRIRLNTVKRNNILPIELREAAAG